MKLEAYALHETKFEKVNFNTYCAERHSTEVKKKRNKCMLFEMMGYGYSLGRRVHKLVEARESASELLESFTSWRASVGETIVNNVADSTPKCNTCCFES